MAEDSYAWHMFDEAVDSLPIVLATTDTTALLHVAREASISEPEHRLRTVCIGETKTAVSRISSLGRRSTPSTA